MFDHGSHNRAYALVWNEAQQTWVPAPERSRSRGKRSGGHAIAAMMGLLASAGAHALDPAAHPSGGNVVAGQAQISRSGNLTTITQATARAVIDWQSFDIGAQASVDFLQPSSSSVALNRVLTQDPTQILGSLHANGQVFIVNPNGVLFGAGAQVSAAGILASTRTIADADFMAGRYTFSGSSTGRVSNDGALTAAPGGYVALVGAQVVNAGTIAAPGGDVRLAAADQVTLRIDGAGMAALSIDRGTLDGLVANRGAIVADGGRIYLTSEARDKLARSVVNNTGLVEAQTVGNDRGTIVLGADMDVGTVAVGGTLDASAPHGGDGGHVDTSAAHVDATATHVVTTLAANGRNGTWVVDPNDFVIANSGGGITPAQVQTDLLYGNVDFNGGAAGDIIVADPVTWAANTLTLNSRNNVQINANLVGTGTASLVLMVGQGAVAAGNTGRYLIADGASISLPAGNHFSTVTGSDGAQLDYFVINTLGAEGSATGTDLQGIQANPGGLYALGADIDASATAAWNAGAGFTPIWGFSGRFDGLGHTVSSLHSAQPGDYVGLFAYDYSFSSIANLTLRDVTASGNANVGGIIGLNDGELFNVHVTSDLGSSVNGTAQVGLVAGQNQGTITQSSAVGSAAGVTAVGGLVGYSAGNLSNVSATATVTASSAQVGGLVGTSEGANIDHASSHGSVTVTGLEMAGGLVGKFDTNGNPSATISDSSSDATVTGSSPTGSYSIGGLVGYAQGAIVDSSAAGTVTGNAQATGGLVGSSDATITGSWATGNVIGQQGVGGLVGSSGRLITGSWASGNVSGDATSQQLGGLVGSTNAAIVDSHASGLVDGGNEVGGLVGRMYGSASISGDTYAQGNVGSSHAAYLVGGLVGRADAGATITSLHAGTGAAATATGSVSATYGAVGGLVGYIAGASIDGATASGNVTSAGSRIGGLVGAAENGGGLASITNSSASGSVSGTGVGGSGSEFVGGLVGYAEGAIAGSSASGNVTATGDRVGGLVGLSPATITGSWASGSVTGATDVGGLVGDGTAISGSHASGAVMSNGYAGSFVGGLAGNINGAVTDSHASGTVDGSDYVGGLVGHMEGSASISGDTYATGAVGAVAAHAAVGGLVGGSNVGATITSTHAGSGSNATASGDVTGSGALVGGLVGYASGTSITGVTASGHVTGGDDFVGGLVGKAEDNGGTTLIANSSASGTVTGSSAGGSNYVGGLAGYTQGSVIGSGASGAVTSSGNQVGGLVGQADGSVASSSASGATSGGSYVGGLVGRAGQSVSGSSASGNVTTATNGSVGGGLVGMLGGALTDSHASGQVDGGVALGGLVGYMLGGSSIAGDSDASGAVGATLAGSDLGGLVGHADGGTTITSTHAGATAAGNVTGTGGNVGGLVGVAYGTTITNVSATGNVASTGPQNVGGLVGYLANAASSIDGATASGTVQGGAASNVGGLVGHAEGAIGNSSATGAVASQGSAVGGLVGKNDGGAISGSWASGDVASGGDMVGGLVGENHAAIDGSHASGNVSGVNTVGGLAGLNDNTLTDTAASGNVTATGNGAGGLVGLDFGAGGVAIASSSASGNVSGHDAVGGLVGALYNGSQTDPNFDAGIGIHALLSVSASGNVSGHSQVGGLAGYNNSGIDAQANNVTVTGSVSASGDAVGGLIGRNDHDGLLTGLVSTNPVTATGGGNGIGGLVGENEGVIINTHAANTVDSDGTAVGGLVGLNVGGNQSGPYTDGEIIYSYSTNTVTGAHAVGGLIGANVKGLVGAVYAAGTVNGDTAVGGLIGLQSSDNQSFNGVLYAYSTATVNGTDQVGGLIGNASGGIILQTYAAGAVHGSGPAVGGLVGAGGALTQDNVYDLQATGQAHSVGDTSNGEVAIGVGTAQMHQAATFAGWSVDTAGQGNGLWRLYEGNTAPLLTFWLTPLTVTVDAGTTTHVYDGTVHGDTFGDLHYTDTLAPGHVLGTASYGAAVNAGTYTALSGVFSDQQGYDIVVDNTGSLTITPATLSATLTGVTKTYDGSTAATLGAGNYVLTGFVQGQGASVTQTAGTYDSKNVIGASSVTATLSGGDYVANDGTLLSNYTLPTSATGAATITPKSISASATGVDKVYDGTLAATANVGLSGVVDGDTVGSTGSASFLDKNVGAAKPVAVSSIVLTGGDASNYVLADTTTTTAAAITPKAITVTATGADKVYDGGVADAATLASSGIVGGDAVTFAGSATFADKNAGVDKAVTVSGITAGGQDAGNYVLQGTTASTTATITPKTITLVATGSDKVYDGSTVDLVTLQASGVVQGDMVGFTGNGSFADKNVGVDKAVTVSGITASGQDAGNYVLANPGVAATATITPRSVVVSASGGDKVYDGSAATSTTLSGANLVAGDDVAFSGSATFADKNAGAGKAVTTTVAASGQDAGNYVFNTTASNTATITPKTITLVATGSDKVYDGSTVDLVTLQASGVVQGDMVGFTGNGSFADKNVGVDKAVTVSGITASGQDAGNYVLANPGVAATATITPRSVVVSASGGDKVYDGSTATSTTLSGANLVAGDDVAFSGSATFADKNAGAGKAVTTTVAASGQDAGNYVFNTTAGSTATITPKTITLVATGSDKVYDGSTVDLVTLQASGVVQGDVVGFTGNGSFADKNVGLGKLVDVTGITASGADAGNYAFAGTGSTTAAVTPRAITVSLTGTVAKVTDGSTTATLDSGNYAVGNLVAGEALIVTRTTGRYDNAGDGQDKTVTVTLSGADYLAGAGTLLSNYQLVSGTLSGQVGLIEPSVKLESALVSLPNLPSGARLAGAPRVDAMQVGAHDDGQHCVQDASRAISAVGSNTRESLLQRRGFSLADGGMRMPAGVAGSGSQTPQP